VTCHDSHTFAVRLVEMGFTHVTVYAGGFAEWQEMGFDVATQGADQ
jgi:rhodanese-related sulfurtransferase